jgi:hypothetical protein
MSELPINPGTIAVAGAMLIPIVAIISACWHRVRRAELEAALRQEEIQLKREMIQRGMSADEIVQILGARSGESAKASRFCHQMQNQ